MSEQTGSSGMQQTHPMETSSEGSGTLTVTSTRRTSPTSPTYGMEARTKQFCNRCNAAGPEMQHTTDKTLVYLPTKNVHKTSIAFISPTKAITKSHRRKTFPCENQVPRVNGVENHRKPRK